VSAVVSFFIGLGVFWVAFTGLVQGKAIWVCTVTSAVDALSLGACELLHLLFGFLGLVKKVFLQLHSEETHPRLP
jgi:hypothetical protein